METHLWTMSCLVQPKAWGGFSRARMLLGSCMSCPDTGPFLAAAFKFWANCRNFAAHSLESRRPPRWGKIFSVIYLCSGNTEAQRLYSYLPILLCFLAGLHGVTEVWQESCIPVHIRATWLDWGVGKGSSSTGSFSTHAMKRWLSFSWCPLPSPQSAARGSS